MKPPVCSLFIGLVKLLSAASQTHKVIASRAERDSELSMWCLIEPLAGMKTVQFRTDLSLSAGCVVSDGGACVCVCVLNRRKPGTDDYFIND